MRTEFFRCVYRSVKRSVYPRAETAPNNKVARNMREGLGGCTRRMLYLHIYEAVSRFVCQTDIQIFLPVSGAAE